MPEEVKDVAAESSPAQTPTETTGNESQTIQPDVTPTPEGNQDLDESGVPWKNRALEWKRKAEESFEKLPSLVEESVRTALSQSGQTQQRDYSIAELEQWAIQHPESRPWVEEEKEKIRIKKLTGEIEARLQTDRKRQETEIKKQNALKFVMETYPECFIKDASGRITSWNNSHPMTQQIGSIMQDARFTGDPEGLAAAAEMAHARFLRGQRFASQQKENQLKAEVKNLQKKTLVEGGERSSVQAKTSADVAFERLQKTGSMKDAKSAILEHLKAQGILKE